jgi:hypothetical protein
MRDRLKNFNWHIHGPSEVDIDYIHEMVKKTIEDRNKILDERKARVEKENPEMAPDILNDTCYYHGLQNLILWQFALWRLQGIFEGLMILKYLRDPSLSKKLIGLKAKLRKMIDSGYTISPDDYDALIEWGELRNALSHCPPEWYGYVDLFEADILEYISLIKKVIFVWDKGKSCLGSLLKVRGLI